MADVPARPGDSQPDGLPRVRGFWSLTLYNEHHFFHPDELNRYPFGPKNKNLHHAGDGSLTLTSSATPRIVDLVAALATGAVGSVALARSDISDTLPGVAIAISFNLVPASFQPVPK